MHRSGLTASAIAGFVAWTGSLLAAALYIPPAEWAGARDLGSMALWSAPFGGIIALAAAASVDGLRTRSLLWTYGGALLLGPTLGFGSFALAVKVRGGWVVAFPVFSCWAFGGLLGLLAAACVTRPRSRWIAGGLATVALGALLLTHSVLRRLG